jgi:outer membrane protein TolC
MTMQARFSILIYGFVLSLLPGLGFGQSTTKLTLKSVVDMAKNNSIAARQAATTKETRYWEFRSFQSNFKPQLLFESRLPSFIRSFNEVVQPDGSIRFQPVRINNSSAGLALQQNVAATGGTVYASTQLQRFDDFAQKSTLYNGSLVSVGISQPILRFNPMKWDKKIEPLKFNESKQEFIESMEKIASTASSLFFDLLLAQVNQTISETNLHNTTEILRIANEKFSAGTNSRNEILQIQLEQLKARKALATAKRDLEISTLNLKAYIGLPSNDKIELLEPEPAVKPAVSPDKALAEAFANRADAIAFGRRLMEAEQAVAKAKGDRGLGGVLTASVGLSNRGQAVADLYRQPQNQELISITFSTPVLDWGRAESKLKTAEANRRLTQYTIEQDKQTFKQQIYTEVTLFEMLKDQMGLTAQADSIATEKYQIAQERYVLGNTTITELSIAFAEKDQARRDFIGALRDYWAAFYRLRWLTLYDFETNEKIK